MKIQKKLEETCEHGFALATTTGVDLGRLPARAAKRLEKAGIYYRHECGRWFRTYYGPAGWRAVGVGVSR